MSLEFFQKQKKLIEDSLAILKVDLKTFQPYINFVTSYRFAFIQTAIADDNYIFNAKLPSVEVWNGEEKLLILKTVDKDEFLYTKNIILEKECN